MKKRKKIILILIILLLLILCIFLFFVFGRQEDSPFPFLKHDDTAQEWEGDQKLPNGKMSKTIEIPGFQSLNLFASSDTQKVNFHNPESNDCLMRMTLFADDIQLWQSGYIEPGKGFYEIALDEVPEIGNYDGRLQVECFKENGTKLNGAVVNFDLEIKE